MNDPWTEQPAAQPAQPQPVGARDLAAQAERTADRLRALSAARLAAGPVESARDLLQRLADLAAEIEHVPSRTVPRLPDHAVADQLAVTATDVVLALGALGGAPLPPGQQAALQAVTADLLALRRQT